LEKYKFLRNITIGDEVVCQEGHTFTTSEDKVMVKTHSGTYTLIIKDAVDAKVLEKLTKEN